MSKISAEETPYVYTEPEGFADSIETGYLGFISFMAEQFGEIQEKWDEERKRNPERYKYADEFYAEALVLSIAEIPSGVIRILDDVPQYVPLNQNRKGEEE